MGLKCCRDGGVDAGPESRHRFVPVAGDRVAFCEDLVFFLVIQNELVFGKDLIQPAPMGVEDVTVQVVFGPDLFGETGEAFPELRAL